MKNNRFSTTTSASAPFKGLMVAAALLFGTVACGNEHVVLNPADFKHHIDYFNRMEPDNVEQIVQAIPNEQSWDFLKGNIPLFTCPQDNFEQMYYFRWWSKRKHIQDTPEGYVVTEFLVPRSYADRYNLISSGLGHQVLEMRWLHDPKYLDQYLHVWYRGNEGKPLQRLNAYSSWTAWTLMQRYFVDKNADFLADMLPDLITEYHEWEQNKRFPFGGSVGDGLFWQIDVRDAMEETISGLRRRHDGRPSINAYMYGNARAIAHAAAMTGKQDTEQLFSAKADTLKSLVEKHLWSSQLNFFETLIRDSARFAGVREAIGYMPWYTGLVTTEAQYNVAWEQVLDEGGFLSPYGLTTAERRHPRFRAHGLCRTQWGRHCECEWDGAVWPFASSQTLTGMANFLNAQPNQSVLTAADYFRHMELLVESQYHRGRPYIGEYLCETTGYWLKGDQTRSYYYNHSTFADLVITGLVGLRPRPDNIIEVNPLIPQDQWDWFALDNVFYHGKIVTIIWDKTGKKFNKGKGFRVLVDGKVVAQSDKLERLEGVMK